MADKTVTIAGLTGRFAGLLTSHLLAKPNVKIHGICRSPQKLPPSVTSNPRVHVFKAEASDIDTLRLALKGSSIAVCCYLGDNKLMIESQKTIIDACIAEGVPRYMASDWSFDFRKLDYGDHPTKDPMKHVADYLQEKNSQIKGVHILNGAFMEVMLNPGQWNAEKNTLRIWGDGNDKFEMTTYSDAAAYSAEVALDDETNGFVCVRAEFLTFKEMAQKFKEVYGEEPELQSQGSLDDCIKVGRANLQNNPSNVWGWMPLFYLYWCLNGKTWMSPEDIVNSNYPKIKPTTFKQLLESHPRADLQKVAMGVSGGSVDS